MLTFIMNKHTQLCAVKVPFSIRFQWDLLRNDHFRLWSSGVHAMDRAQLRPIIDIASWSAAAAVNTAEPSL